ncbi:MAG TPA: hypothetical protein VM100_09165 [Longimicrobiales bacterium]|nr:hypothetical protein [Longimicrobiales bacterium]
MTILQLVIVGMVLIIVATVTLAVLSYGAFRVRERHAPRKSVGAASDEPMFFERVRVTPRSPDALR